MFFCATLTDCRGDHNPFVPPGVETSNTGAEAVKPDQRCSWRAIPGDWVPMSGMKIWSLIVLSYCSSFHLWYVEVPHLLLSSEELMSCCVTGTNGCFDLTCRTCPPGGQVSAEWSKGPGSITRFARDSVARLRQSTAGWMPVRRRRLSAAVGHRHPVTIHKVSLMTGSMRWVWALRHQTRAQYSVVECTSSQVAVRNIVAPALQPKPASNPKSTMCDISFLQSDLRCQRYVIVLSNITPSCLVSGKNSKDWLLKLSFSYV